jgi:gliding motility-associated-like protein
MKKHNQYLFISSLVLALCFGRAQAQWVNNGAIVAVNANTIVMLNQTDFIHQKGDFNLDGWMGLSEKASWTNNDATTKGLNASSLGTVEFNGADQQIGGTNTTLFYNLWLKGTGIKAITIDQEVKNELDLTDRELALQNANISIGNPAINAIKRSTGFISSSTLLSNIIRITNAGETYVFPTGSSKNDLGYRPVVLKGTDALGKFSVSLLKQDPTLSGLTTTASFKNGLYDINTNFYYQIQQLSGAAPVDVSALFNNKTDGDFKELAFWDKTAWLPARATPAQGLYGDNLTTKVFKNALAIKGLQYFVLANKSAENTLFIPNSFSPNGDGKNEKWVVPSLDLYPDNHVRITNRWGDEIYNMKSYNSSNAFDGHGLNEGTYYYFISVNINGVAKTYAGYFTLLR